MKEEVKMFKVVKLLNKKGFENRFISDEDGKQVTNPKTENL